MMKKRFDLMFIACEEFLDYGIDILYGNDGNFSVIFSLENFAEQFSADGELYDATHFIYMQIVKLLAEDYIIQKTDAVSTQIFNIEITDKQEYLTQKYFQHFNGRKFKKIDTFLTITKIKKNTKFFTYSENEMIDFINKINKIKDIFSNNNIKNKILKKDEILLLHKRFLALNFKDNQFALNNFRADEKGIYTENKTLKTISLIDIEEMNFAQNVQTHYYDRAIGEEFPVDNLSFILTIPADTIILNQVIILPAQRKTKTELELKKKRHESMQVADKENLSAAEDIDAMFLDIAENNEMLVKCHFGLMVIDYNEHIFKAVNAVENNLFSINMIPNKNTNNQLELYRSAIPGNAAELKEYDLFLTSRAAALALFFKEKLPKTDNSDYLLWFTDRQGVPIGIDTSELPMVTNRIQNRNRFILGPSGSGKSFFTNSYALQCWQLGADIVLVDTGHSYFGLCEYIGGRYITYTEDKPITMNPFKIERVEYNDEKKQSLKDLIGVIWKGAEGSLTKVENQALMDCITAYYADYFSEQKIVKTLSFNSFYDYSIEYINAIIEVSKIRFDIEEYKFVLRAFYKGGIYETILNNEADTTLFGESFIVFEIDNIKDNKELFPITTLIIMDVFIQKMRHKNNKKILIIEEAWKAIASPMMANYILYLYKTVRKFYGEAIVVTQELDDIIGNQIVKESIINNSDTIMLLDQTKFKERFDKIADLLSINQIERNKIFTMNNLDNKSERSKFKEVYIKRGSVGEVYGVEVPLEQYLTFTTERTEKDAIKKYLKKTNSYRDAIELFVSDFKKSDTSLQKFVKHVNSTF